MTEWVKRLTWYDPEPPVGSRVIRYGRVITRLVEGWHLDDGDGPYTWLDLFEVGGQSDWVGLLPPLEDAP